MKREEEIEKKAEELAKKYLPDDNMWERPNIVEAACLEMAKWSDEHPRKGLVDIEDVCKYLDKYLINDSFNREPVINFVNGECFKETFISHLRKAMEK